MSEAVGGCCSCPSAPGTKRAAAGIAPPTVAPQRKSRQIDPLCGRTMREGTNPPPCVPNFTRSFVESTRKNEPISTVAIKAQISGELLQVHFKEGDFVRKGQLLFTIDSRIPQGQVGTMQANIEKDEAQLKQVEANLARETAQLEYARSESERY